MNYFNAEINNLWALNMPAVEVNGELSRVPSYFIPELLAAAVTPSQLAAYNALALVTFGAPPYPTMQAAFDEMPAATAASGLLVTFLNAAIAEYGGAPATTVNGAATDLAELSQATALAFTTDNVGALYNPPVTWETLATASATMAGQNNQVLVQVNPLLTTTNGTGTATNLEAIATQAAAAQTVALATLAESVALAAASIGGATPVTLQAAGTAMNITTQQITRLLDYIAGLGGPTNIVGPGTTYATFEAFLTAQGVP